MIRAGFLFLMAGLMAPAALAQTACPPGTGEAACMLDAAWTAAQDLPEAKQDRVKPLFVPLALKLSDPKARDRWDIRLGDAGAEIEGHDYVRQTAETAVREYGWEGFLQRAQAGLAPLHMGRPEIMGAAIALAPDAKQRDRLVRMMFDLAGTPSRNANVAMQDFERGDFGHVLAERMMRDCKLAEFDRAVALTAVPDALIYKLWRTRISGGAGALADEIRTGEGRDDTSHVRQALEGYGAVISLGYCPK
jgi:hypothetical protein